MEVPQFDAVIHAPGRLQICALLSVVEKMEFSAARDSIGVSDSVMSKHLKLLEEAGYVGLSKIASAGRSRTWLSLTPAGRAAFKVHTETLVRLAGLS